ncbi:hypothetical protein D778_00578 [Xanthomarina gelatinilytica]|uniref:Uncharacterized protein n=1 Tax=Xanthomarina gelatinilytica TaxID=1137281 RepID=M7MYQ1_9FLAO|nr:hypothetical protein D778_00578 [Xanthomarina gelatinilytica]
MKRQVNDGDGCKYLYQPIFGVLNNPSSVCNKPLYYINDGKTIKHISKGKRNPA